MLADDTMMLQGAKDLPDIFQESFNKGADVESEVVWITKPSVCESKNDYVAYGNEANGVSERWV